MKMKRVRLLSIVLLFIFAAACRAQTAPVTEIPPAATAVDDVQGNDAQEAPAPQADTEQDAPAPATAVADPQGNDAQDAPAPETGTEQDAPAADLPLLPPFQEANGNGIGSPLPEGEEDPFAAAVFTLATELPEGPATAVVQEHSFGLLDEAEARVIADGLGFSGPLYVQQIAPEFAPAEGEDQFTMFTAFNGSRLLNISDNGVTFEDRGVTMNYDRRPTFAETAPLVEAQLKKWGLLDFPYEIKDVDDSIVMVHRLIDGIANNQNEFNTVFNDQGQLYYFDYRPLREITDVGRYPLQTAAMAWQQVQQPAGRESIRYEIRPPQSLMEGTPAEDFVNPRSWTPLSDAGQELHLYVTPAVYEATDGSGLRLMYGDFTLAGDEAQLAEMATHLADVLHVWGKANRVDGAKTLDVEGWEQVEMVNYETIEGTVETQEDGQRVLLSLTGETFILPAVPADVENGVAVYASAMARRDTGAGHPLLDWNSLTEKIEWPEMVIAPPDPDPDPITEVIVDGAELIYFTLYQSAGVPGEETTLLLLPVWQFSGESNAGQTVTLWVPAAAPETIAAAEAAQ